MSDSKTPLGFIGLGVMGEPMCANLVRKSGHPVYVTDINAEPVTRIGALGGRACTSIIEVAQSAEIVFLSLPSIVQVEQVCTGPGGLVEAAGRVRIVVDMSTSDVTRTRQLAEKLRAHGILLIDAPVARMREAARLGTLMITVGATQEDYETVLPYLSCMGTDVLLCGGVGNGQVVKIMNNMVVFMTVHALAEAITIGRSAGVDGALLLDALSKGSADSFVLRNPGQKALAAENYPEKTFPTEYAIKDILLALELARQGEVDARSAKLTHDLLERTRAAGYVKEYYPVMVKLIERGYQ
ncbi:NAD(P)-dependent oxidoreductase [Achromobacter anxifer]|uniref:2-(Hydroxymethyl)glutarate dehydrogenase n=1 Tax=Achromobacter anxifer TaxID=1287737 RepID=A0A6S7CI16_9BURK|nr:NAD(P)-dependent oxidoreductase [Achromobacter anxifer]MDF8360751.1 NAD(P)-dependent oxidoreductase [Achromobacter anxifer]CAB3849287.1 2-(hydroxymethyl)glutarate dehydrogenase [Achromobacter anxifer]CAB5513708.1 2-(hydroxymethyl)glutarate dehydrogenase [Achromobacter anxifer]